MKNTIRNTLLLFLPVFGCSLCAAAQDAILGKWWTPQRTGQVEIYKKQGKYFGRLTWTKTPGKKDKHNPDPALRRRDLLGLDLFTNFRYESDDNEWVDGKAYDPSSGKLYSCKMWLGHGNNTLNARGYIGFSLLGRTEKLARVE